jgi:hypothetical protein
MFTTTAYLIVLAILFTLLGIASFICYRMARQGSRLMVTAALKRFASDFSLEFWPDKSPYHLDLARQTGRSRDGISNVLLRKLGDAELVWFEVQVSGGSMARHEPRVAIRKPGKAFPKFALAKRTFASRVSLWTDMKRVPSRDQSLDARLNLYGDDLEAVRRLFEPSLREKLASPDITASMIVRGNGEWLLFNVKGFRSVYVWPSIAMVTQDLKTFLSWMGKAIAAAGLFFPIETGATTFRVLSADGLLVRGAGRDKSDTLLVLGAIVLGLLAAMPTLVVEGDSAAVATGVLLAAALIATGAFVSRRYKRALARTINSLARGL